MVKRIILIVAIAMFAFSGVALALDTAVVDVSATVVGTCQFNSGGTVSFTLDPSIGGLATGTVTQPQFWCTRNASYTITDDDGVNDVVLTEHRMIDDATSTEYIPYTFTYTATGTGNGPTSPITMNIASTVAAAAYVNASAGSYSDTVTLTINP
jgi:spore coat protein U-like protein